MRNLLALIVFGLVFSFGLPSHAQTPDGMTPAEETICDYDEHFGLCNSYCEALDCDSDEGYAQHEKACDKVLANYSRITNGKVPSCVREAIDCDDGTFVCGENPADYFCNLGVCETPSEGADGGPYCLSTITGEGICAFGFSCENLAPCNVNVGCAQGATCVVDTCCSGAGSGSGVCVPDAYRCPLPVGGDTDPSGDDSTLPGGGGTGGGVPTPPPATIDPGGGPIGGGLGL